MKFNTTCNATLDDMMIGNSEVPIVGGISFHNLSLIISAACTLIAVMLSLYLMWMHALHYTKPREQRHIIRILFMIPVYAMASFLSLWFYWHTIYFSVISDCYEAFAIASFFALLCHYIAPNLHDQKNYFRAIQPKGWVWPLSWIWYCSGRDKGFLRTPRSGLTWFNVIWAGVYQYCFIRVSMTITAVLTQHFGRYCESSNSPVFAHIWLLVIEGLAVTVAMFCLIQFYYQLRYDLASHSPLLKVVAIKLVIFLSFWQSFGISILTSSTFDLVKPTKYLAYPDLTIGIPSLLLCIEMACFSVLHLVAFSWRPYGTDRASSKYPSSAGSAINENDENLGGLLGWRAILDALNPWDIVKAFARGMRWLTFGRRNRENDPSYLNTVENPNGITLESPSIESPRRTPNSNIPIASFFAGPSRRNIFGISGGDGKKKSRDEAAAGLITNAQPNPHVVNSGYTPAKERYDAAGQEIRVEGTQYDNKEYTPEPSRQESYSHQNIGVAIPQPEPYQSHVNQPPYPPETSADVYLEQKRAERRQRSSTPEEYANGSQPAAHNALWGTPQAGKEDQ